MARPDADQRAEASADQKNARGAEWRASPDPDLTTTPGADPEEARITDLGTGLGAPGATSSRAAAAQGQPGHRGRGPERSRARSSSPLRSPIRHGFVPRAPSALRGGAPERSRTPVDSDLGGPDQPPQLFPDAVRAPPLPSPICTAPGHRLRPFQGRSVKNGGSPENRPERQGCYQAVERPSVSF